MGLHCMGNYLFETPLEYTLAALNGWTLVLFDDKVPKAARFAGNASILLLSAFSFWPLLVSLLLSFWFKALFDTRRLDDAMILVTEFCRIVDGKVDQRSLCLAKNSLQRQDFFATASRLLAWNSQDLFNRRTLIRLVFRQRIQPNQRSEEGNDWIRISKFVHTLGF